MRDIIIFITVKMKTVELAQCILLISSRRGLLIQDYCLVATTIRSIQHIMQKISNNLTC
jgi:hypothetical protein